MKIFPNQTPVEENSYVISRRMINWYQDNKRDLPWRATQDPYRIWISEIILQQTRVAQGMDYYQRFIERFPNVETLAAAEEDEVLKLWQGLGYYSRARNLHAAACEVVNQFSGKFPADYKQLCSLKGIGPYTAAAIASFAWNLPYAVVDGNVYRVLSRLFAIDTPIDTTEGKKLFQRMAEELLDPATPGLHNQAIMELGALQCVPNRPDCPTCPLQECCAAFTTDRVADYPVKQHKPKQRNRYFHYLYIICKGKTWLFRRPAGDIWQGLYEFPLIETECQMNFTQLQATKQFHYLLDGIGKVEVSACLEGVKHQLTHQLIHASFYRLEIEHPSDCLLNVPSISTEQIDEYAVPRLIEIYLERLSGDLLK